MREKESDKTKLVILMRLGKKQSVDSDGSTTHFDIIPFTKT
jgi:hypothetical protein